MKAGEGNIPPRAAARRAGVLPRSGDDQDKDGVFEASDSGGSEGDSSGDESDLETAQQKKLRLGGVPASGLHRNADENTCRQCTKTLDHCVLLPPGLRGTACEAIILDPMPSASGQARATPPCRHPCIRARYLSTCRGDPSQSGPVRPAVPILVSCSQGVLAAAAGGGGAAGGQRQR